MKIFSACLVLIVVAFSTTAEAKLYKWGDDKGVTHKLYTKRQEEYAEEQKRKAEEAARVAREAVAQRDRAAAHCAGFDCFARRHL